MASNADTSTTKGRRKAKVISLVAGLLLAVGVAAYFTVLKPSGPVEPEKGDVVSLDPIQLNLAGGHYLRLGLALQMTKDATEGVDGSEALDSAVDILSGQSLDRLAKPSGRRAMLRTLADHVVGHYPGQVMDVYFTEFVTQ